MTRTTNRREQIIYLVKKFKERIPEEVLLLIGSVGYGGETEVSDIDLICVAKDSYRIIEILNSLDVELSNDEIEAYRDYIYPKTYFIFNLRLELGGIETSCIFIDIKSLEEASEQKENLFLLRNSIRNPNRILYNFLGKRIELPLLTLACGQYFITNYNLFFEAEGSYSHGSIINKIIDHPIYLESCNPATNEKTLKAIKKLFNKVSRRFSEAKENNPRAEHLLVCDRHPRFDDATKSFLFHQVYQLDGEVDEVQMQTLA